MGGDPAAAETATVRRRTYAGLFGGLVVDNLGSGMFLPLSVVFVVRAVGLSVGQAGTILTAGTLVGLFAPAVVGRVVDRTGPLVVVVASMLIQASGMMCYLLANGAALTFAAAALVATGAQTFYSALFALLSSVVGTGPKDRIFAAVSMARAAAFGAGALVAGLLLTVASANGLRVAVAADALSFLAAAGLLAFSTGPRDVALRRAGPTAGPRSPSAGVMRDRPFLVLIATVALLGLVADLFLVGLPVYALTVLHRPGWVPGVCLAMLTLATSTLGTVVVRATNRISRIATLGIGAAFYVSWCVLAAGAAAIPTTVATGWLLGSTVVLIAGSLAVTTRANAIAEAASPARLRGRYLAAFQYAYGAAGLLAPLVVALFAVSRWLPWLVGALCASIALTTLPWLARSLPRRAVHPS